MFLSYKLQRKNAVEKWANYLNKQIIYQEKFSMSLKIRESKIKPQ